MHLVLLFGPQAVGKLAVGRELAARTPYRLLHNHATIEPLLEVFEYGAPPFRTLNEEFRRRVVEEALAAGLPGLVFTYAWALDVAEDTAYLEGFVEPVLAAGGRVDFVELYADEATRLAREGTPVRLAAKPSKRDVAWARDHLVEWGQRYRLSTGPDVPFPLEHPHLRLDTTHGSAADTAEEVIRRLDLPRS
ncbi:AAA family ATPase [Nocardioides dongkuii]|uniref:AAA family ATPase n=1 Tax=Nocardioides dongkuii TaxID=2760089 RepID=UPI0015F81786|nr:AAA family ATPase [Nocardioides dongkuii]